MMGGDANVESSLGRPAFHIYGPSIAYRFVINPHRDEIYYKPTVNGQPCKRGVVKSFSLSLSMPSGGGMAYWSQSGRHHTDKVEGELLVWNGDVVHSIAQTPNGRQWDLDYINPYQWRITIQAFGVHCGGKWYLFH
jgi:hypothetical protein